LFERAALIDLNQYHARAGESPPLGAFQFHTANQLTKNKALAFEQVFNDKLAKIKYYYTNDDGETWKEISTLEKNSTELKEVVPIDGTQNFRLKIRLETDTEGFRNVNEDRQSAIIPYSQVAEIPTSAPFYLSLDNPPVDNNVVVRFIGVGSIGLNGQPITLRRVQVEERKFILPTADSSGKIVQSHSLTGYSNSNVALLGSIIDYGSIVVKSIDGTYVFQNGIDYDVDQVNRRIVFRQQQSDVFLNRSLSAVGTGQQLIVSLPYSRIDASSLVVAHGSTILASGVDYIYNDDTKQVIILSSIDGDTYTIAYTSIHYASEIYPDITISYNSIEDGFVTEYVVATPFDYISDNITQYIIYVDGQRYTIIDNLDQFTSDTQVKIYNHGHELAFSHNINGRTVEIMLKDEAASFTKSSPHTHSLKFASNGIQDELSCYHIDGVKRSTITVPLGSKSYQLDNPMFVLSLSLSQGSVSLVQNQDYTYDMKTGVIIFSDAVLGNNDAISVTYDYYDVSYYDLTYTSQTGEEVQISGIDYIVLKYEDTFILNNSYVITPYVSLDYGYKVTPNIIPGTLEVVDSNGNLFTVIEYIDGVKEFSSYGVSDLVCSVNRNNNIIYMNTKLDTSALGTLSISFEYNLFRIGYGLAIKLDSAQYTITKNQITFADSFISKAITSGTVSKNILIVYNIKDDTQPTLAQLQPYYTPFLFDYAIVFGES